MPRPSEAESRSQEIAARLKRAMDHQGVKDRQLASHIGVALSTVGYWRRGQRPIPASYIEPICQLLKITPDVLIFGQSFNPQLILSPEEVRLLRAFRKMPEYLQEATADYVEKISRRR